MIVQKQKMVNKCCVNLILRMIIISGLLVFCMVAYWAFLESQPALGNIPATLHLAVIFGLILMMYFMFRKIVRGLLQEIRVILNRLLPKSPSGRREVKKPIIWAIILFSRGCYVLSGVLLFCSLIERDYYVIESPGWLLIVPILLSMLAIKLVRAYRMENSLLWGIFYSVFAWILVVGYIQAYLGYIYPDSLFCLA